MAGVELELIVLGLLFWIAWYLGELKDCRQCGYSMKKDEVRCPKCGSLN